MLNCSKTALPLFRPLRQFSLYILVLLFSSLLIASCLGAKKSLYPAEYPLSYEMAYTPSGSVTLRIPEGWTAAEDKECRCIDIWLLKGDFSATMSLVDLKADPVLLQKLEKDEIKALLGYSKELKKARLKESFRLTGREEVFEINKKKYAAYEYQAIEGDTVRVIVLKQNGHFYELSAMPALRPEKVQRITNRELFGIQQSVLTSIR